MVTYKRFKIIELILLLKVFHYISAGSIERNLTHQTSDFTPLPQDVAIFNKSSDLNSTKLEFSSTSPQQAFFLPSFFSRNKQSTTEETPKAEKYVSIISTSSDGSSVTYDSSWSSTISDVQNLLERVNATLSMVQSSTTESENEIKTDQSSSESDFSTVRSQFTSSDENFTLEKLQTDQNFYEAFKVDARCLSCMNSCLSGQFCRKESYYEQTTEFNFFTDEISSTTRGDSESSTLDYSSSSVTFDDSTRSTNENSSNDFSSIFTSSNDYLTTSSDASSTENSSTFSESSTPTNPVDLTSSHSPSDTTESSTLNSEPSQRDFLIKDLIKVTQELHAMRVKFDILNRDLMEERKVNRDLVKFNEECASENHEKEVEIEKFKLNEEFNGQKIQNLTSNLNFVVKILEIERYKKGIMGKFDEFGMTEEIKSANSTSIKFTLFELETDDSHVSLVSNQKLITIPSRLVEIAPKLSEFSATNCGLEFIDGSSFEELESLKLLNLSRNSISKVENETFEYLAGLQTLDLSFNLIEKVEISSFFGLNNLLILNLSNNKISSLPAQLLATQTSLKVLQLSQNLITELTFEIFPSQLSLDEFYIDNNLLTFVDAKVIEGLENASVVDMRSNLCVDSRVPEDGGILKLGLQVGGNCNAAKFNEF